MLGIHACNQGPWFFDLFFKLELKRTSLQMLKKAIRQEKTRRKENQSGEIEAETNVPTALLNIWSSR